MGKKIIFLSLLDFKDKSIQVIKKTPEAYANAGWDVDYVVGRNNSKYGNYFYEKEINPERINVHRFYLPCMKIIDKIPVKLFRVIMSQLIHYLSIIKLAIYVNKIIKTKKIDILYGYEVYGVLAVFLLRIFGKARNIKIISRFQGTWLSEYFKNRKIIKILLNIDSLFAFYVKSDLCIMTNDGTSGDKLFTKLKTKNLKNFKFWVNGVDKQFFEKKFLESYQKKFKLPSNKYIAVSICRLEEWKRIDRAILVVNKIIKEYNYNNLSYYILGDGAKRNELEDLVMKLGIQDNIYFMGSVKNSETKYYLEFANIFFSTNELSNVGNPLLEAIRANKIIFTLNNGDTNSWIQHRFNGFIYDIGDSVIENMSKDVFDLLNDKNLQKQIITNIKETEKKKLWTWDERLRAEVDEASKLLKA